MTAQSGYDEGLFIQDVDSNLICSVLIHTQHHTTTTARATLHICHCVCVCVCVCNGVQICQAVARNCEVSECIHSVCSSCLNGVYALSREHQKCPSCKIDLPAGSERKLDARTNYLISHMKVKCVHHTNGCDAVYDIGNKGANIVNHAKVCEYALTPCTHCDDQMMRRDIEHHESSVCVKRPTLCRRCNEYIRVDKFKKHRANEYKCKNLLPCPNQCTPAEYHHHNENVNDDKKRIDDDDGNDNDEVGDDNDNETRDDEATYKDADSNREQHDAPTCADDDNKGIVTMTKKAKRKYDDAALHTCASSKLSKLAKVVCAFNASSSSSLSPSSSSS